MFTKRKLGFDDIWKVYLDDELYAVLIPNGYTSEDISSEEILKNRRLHDGEN